MLRHFLGRLFGQTLEAPSRSVRPSANDWASSVAIWDRGDPIEVLPPVSHHVDLEPWVKLDDVEMEYPLEKYIEHDKFPLPSKCDREGYHGDRHYDYWLSGLKDYLSIKQILVRYGTSLGGPAAVLDFGCASGRVLRHFLCHEPGIEIWGTDVNFRHIEWIRKFLGPSPRVFQNSLLPHLPLEDRSMSLVYGLSVFTHIDRFELAWLYEIRRILWPGGIAYLTVHTDHTWSILGPTHMLYYDLIEAKHLELSPECFKKPMPGERLVFRWPHGNVYAQNVFLSIEYIHDIWQRCLDVLEVIREGSDYQDVVVLRKRA
jgi:SAM-dependent methyltransferase